MTSSLGRAAALFLPAAPPREGRVAFWYPQGAPTVLETAATSATAADGAVTDDGAVTASAAVGGVSADARRVDLTVVRSHGPSVRTTSVPALTLPLADALPLLVRARRQPDAHPATACWGAGALLALRLVARGRLLPGLTADDHDAWRAGPLDAEDLAQLRAVAAALPHEGHAAPLTRVGTDALRKPLELPEPEALVRAFLDAVADTLPRT
ncbi:ATP-dependent helicase, partial [Streptomyces sp. O3]